MRLISRILTVAAVAAAAGSCGDVVRNSRAPVLLIIDQLSATKGGSTATASSFLLSDVLTIVTTPAPCSTTSPCATIFNDVGSATLRISPKDIGPVGLPASPSANNAVTIHRVHIAYRRADGRNVQGVDVPWAFDGAATGTVPATGQLTLGFEIVRHDAKLESPLVQLQSNGVIITTIADITFYGTDQVGNDISVAGSMQIDFGNFGD